MLTRLYLDPFRKSWVIRSILNFDASPQFAVLIAPFNVAAPTRATIEPDPGSLRQLNDVSCVFILHNQAEVSQINRNDLADIAGFARDSGRGADGDVLLCRLLGEDCAGGGE